MDPLPPAAIKQKQKGPRSSVSAEAFGSWNKKSDFKAREVEKSAETSEKIFNRLG